MKCEICGKEFEQSCSLSLHISKTHKITLEEYGIKYLNIQPASCPICGKMTHFVSLNVGYTKFCSRECQIKGCSKNQKFRYILQGMSEEEAIKAVSKFQSECGKKAQQHILPEHCNTKIEYWMAKRLY